MLKVCKSLIKACMIFVDIRAKLVGQSEEQLYTRLECVVSEGKTLTARWT